MNTRRKVNAFAIGIITAILYALVLLGVKLILGQSLNLTEALVGAVIFGLVFFAIQNTINTKLGEKPVYISK